MFLGWGFDLRIEILIYKSCKKFFWSLDSSNDIKLILF